MSSDKYTDCSFLNFIAKYYNFKMCLVKRHFFRICQSLTFKKPSRMMVMLCVAVIQQGKFNALLLLLLLLSFYFYLPNDQPRPDHEQLLKSVAKLFILLRKLERFVYKIVYFDTDTEKQVNLFWFTVFVYLPSLNLDVFVQSKIRVKYSSFKTGEKDYLMIHWNSSSMDNYCRNQIVCLSPTNVLDWKSV